jgi:hypothetical protein
MDPTKADLLQQCQRHFPGLAWENYSGGVSCIAKIPSIIFDQALVVYSNGDGDFEVLLQTNIEGSRLAKRLWVGADAIAQAAERWREFVEEAGDVVVETKDCSYDAEADPVFRPRFGLLVLQKESLAAAMADQARAEDNPPWPEPGPECRLEIKYQPKGSGRNLRTIEEAMGDV